MNIFTLGILKEFETYIDSQLKIYDPQFTKQYFKYHIRYVFVLLNIPTFHPVNFISMPLMFKEPARQKTFTIQYNLNNTLVTQFKKTPYRFNWKLQHQRHQTVKLLQITG